MVRAEEKNRETGTQLLLHVSIHSQEYMYLGSRFDHD